MRVFTLIFLMPFIVHSQVKRNDLFDKQLKGQVKSVIQEQYAMFEDSDWIGKLNKDSMTWKLEYYFNKDGNLTKELSTTTAEGFDYERILKYEGQQLIYSSTRDSEKTKEKFYHNSEENIRAEYSIKNKDTIGVFLTYLDSNNFEIASVSKSLLEHSPYLDSTVFVWDMKGYLIKEIYFDNKNAKGDLSYEAKFDSYSRVLVAYMISNDGKHKGLEEHFDDHGNTLKKIRFNKKGEITEKIEFQLEIDKKGNWISRNVRIDGKWLVREERKIKYY